MYKKGLLILNILNKDYKYLSIYYRDIHISF